MIDVEKNTQTAKKPRLRKRSGTEQTSLAFEVVNGDVIEVVEGKKHKVSGNLSGNDKGRNNKTRRSHSDSAEALRIMQSYGYSINTPKERRTALNDYKRINKRAAKKRQTPLKRKETASYASVSREQFPKDGSGFKVVSGSVETNRRKH